MISSSSQRATGRFLYHWNPLVETNILHRSICIFISRIDWALLANTTTARRAFVFDSPAWERLTRPEHHHLEAHHQAVLTHHHPSISVQFLAVSHPRLTRAVSTVFSYLRRRLNEPQSRTATVGISTQLRVEQDQSQPFWCTVAGVPKSPPCARLRRRFFAVRWRFAEIEPPLHSPRRGGDAPPIRIHHGASPEVAPLVANTAELEANSPELTRPSHPLQQTQQKQQPTKSFAEVLSGSSQLRHDERQKSQPSEFRKFFLADSNEASIESVQNINGCPTLVFSDSETESLATDFHLALIGKFSHGSPPYSQLHRLLAKTGLKGAFTVSMINKKHALVSLSNEFDYTRLWLRRIWYLDGLPMRVFKWTPTFTPDHESSITPVWVSFPGLPTHLFRKDALFALANNIGTPLQIADSTHNKSNFSKARVCVEVDLLKPLLEEIDLKIYGATIVQKIEYEQVPPYCFLCKHIGHHDSECYSKGDAPKPPRRGRAATESGKKRYVPTSASAPINENGSHVVENAALDDVNTQPVVELDDENDAEIVVVARNVEEIIDVNVNVNDETHEDENAIVVSDVNVEVKNVGQQELIVKNTTMCVGTYLVRNAFERWEKRPKRIKLKEAVQLFKYLKHLGRVCPDARYCKVKFEKGSRFVEAIAKVSSVVV
ncbi:UNVERIFIED_CONTAM: hypothetical protein Sradi_4094200 [Sesamum radiatum]|uniref:DUF4283 domain-containing protein n=1 Tax=Sesamum radiatum TaxID=300843 RepID=A0AAW2PKS1_SESRA